MTLDSQCTLDERNRLLERFNAVPKTGAQSEIIAECLYLSLRLQQFGPASKRNHNDEQNTKAILLQCFPEITKALIERDRLDGIEPPDLIDENAHQGRA